MATLLWTAVYFFLLLEIVILLILLIPLPSFIAKKVPTFFSKILKNRTVFVVILTILSLCFMESVRTQMKCNTQLDELQSDDPVLNRVTVNLNKFRSERNMYLSGFSLFFIFVIWRVALLHGEIEEKGQNEKSSKVESSETPIVDKKEVSSPSVDKEDVVEKHPKTD